MASPVVFGMEDILSLLPHRPPFLFVDRITKFSPDASIAGERDIRPDEFFFAGHFPGKPIMPGALVVDALAQTSGLLWGFSKRARGGETADTPELFYLAAANVKFVSPAYPDETLELVARADRSFGDLFLYNVEATVRRKVVARGSLTLAMMKGSL
ncbi:MAG: 3-hydroxyacyl-[acyl-carrier-protein] dehydratase FabZ [Chitinivibrionales bacterium]|nr:3-hydroxyacyl-[acyl-carrier-protein] dehydratase FabZ [Chitinivibrionales bacterium]MBD3395954.1 3-hydroxyacyl-[acyl-carrier-protein] dehydratase FabZ [Chitinivibrionales bacterium]